MRKKFKVDFTIPVYPSGGFISPELFPQTMYVIAFDMADAQSTALRLLRSRYGKACLRGTSMCGIPIVINSITQISV